MFTVMHAGLNMRHPDTFFISQPAGTPGYLLLVVRTKASFTIGQDSFVTTPNSAVLIKHSTPYFYRGLDGEYADDWVHFDCSQEDLESISGICFNLPFSLSNPAVFSSYIQQILWEKNEEPTDVFSHAEPDRLHEENLDMLIRLLLHNLLRVQQAGTDCSPYNPYLPKLQSLRLTLQTEPCRKYSTEQIAASLGISVSYFQHLYRKLFDVSFQTDLIHMRIEYAKGLLLNTDLTIARIAELCGYSSEIHFYRQFRKVTGMTPSAYRKACS